jgi:hypothetical protein
MSVLRDDIADLLVTVLNSICPLLLDAGPYSIGRREAKIQNLREEEDGARLGLPSVVQTKNFRE